MEVCAMSARREKPKPRALPIAIAAALGMIGRRYFVGVEVQF
jgi:hypothetical protein